MYEVVSRYVEVRVAPTIPGKGFVRALVSPLKTPQGSVTAKCQLLLPSRAASSIFVVSGIFVMLIVVGGTCVDERKKERSADQSQLI
jgi:hypothetical protein